MGYKLPSTSTPADVYCSDESQLQHSLQHRADDTDDGEMQRAYRAAPTLEGRRQQRPTSVSTAQQRDTVINTEGTNSIHFTEQCSALRAIWTRCKNTTAVKHTNHFIPTVDCMGHPQTLPVGFNKELKLTHVADLNQLHL